MRKNGSSATQNAKVLIRLNHMAFHKDSRQQPMRRLRKFRDTALVFRTCRPGGPGWRRED